MDKSIISLLNENIPTQARTQFWKLMKKAIPLFRNHISKIPGNGKTILIWEDRIMGEEPLKTHLELEGIGKRMIERGLNTLHSMI